MVDPEDETRNIYSYAPMVFARYAKVGLVSWGYDQDLILHEPARFIRKAERIEMNGRILYVRGNHIYIDDLIWKLAEDLHPTP